MSFGSSSTARSVRMGPTCLSEDDVGEDNLDIWDISRMVW